MQKSQSEKPCTSPREDALKLLILWEVNVDRIAQGAVPVPAPDAN